MIYEIIKCVLSVIDQKYEQKRSISGVFVLLYLSH